ncbi:GDSL-type esterase/lipase family protein [Nocardioides caeni]|nr:GDSL-type esterase/lipase family protein [Nocardioides caeni]
MRAPVLVLLVAALTALLGLPSTAEADAAPTATSASTSEHLRIMLLGDSVTQGATGDWTWRYRLWQHLRDDGVAFDLVGPRADLHDSVTDHGGSTAYADPAFDRDHAARWGMWAGFLDVPVADLMADHDPDVLVVMLGVNDVLFQRPVPDVVDSLRGIVATARSARPDVRVVLAEATQTWFAGVPELNAGIAALTTELDSASSPVELADAATDYTIERTRDGSHPDAEGERLIADRIARALARLGIGSDPVPPPVPALTAPGNVRAVAGLRCARMAWSRVPGAASYQVLRWDGRRWRLAARPTVQRATLTRLPVARVWRLRVRAVRPGEVGPPRAVRVVRRTGRC